MRDIQISRPVLIALIGAILVGGYMFYASSQSTEEVVPTTPAPTGATTGQTGPSGPSGATGATGESKPTAAERRAKRRKRLIAAAKKAGVPLDVYVARRRGKEVVIFFWEPRGKDDRRVDQSLAAVKKERRKLVIFRERISNKSRYDGIAEAADLTQTPSMVILYRGRADVIEGFIDPDTLAARIGRLSD
ncbi:MAG: hypothetical protein WAP37_06005 [Solirubrobacterales bacterium]